MTEQRPPIYPGEWLSESPWLERQAVGLQKAQKPVVVTQEMIEAGIRASSECDPSDTIYERFDAIYLAMRALEPKA